MAPPLLVRILPQEEYRQLISRATRRMYESNEVIFHEGDPADSLHVIVRGRVAVSVTSPEGQPLTFAIMGEGELFGELALLRNDQLRSATVRALERTETLVVHRHDFTRLRQARPAVADLLIHVLSQRVLRLSDQLQEALYLPVQTRILRRLVELAGRYDAAKRPVVIPLTQYDLAGLAGTARATVNRVLRVEEGLGSIRLDRGRITVLDLPSLARRAGLSAPGRGRRPPP